MADRKKLPNLYDILGVDKSASTSEVKRAYRKKVLETHPDKLDPAATDQERQAAEREFHKVQDAFETLGDPAKKRRYDAVSALRFDPESISKHSAHLMADRAEWARQQAEISDRRMAAFTKQLEDRKMQLEQQIALRKKKIAATRVPLKTTDPTSRGTKSTASTVPPQTADPTSRETNYLSKTLADFEVRRRVALQRKAEREEAARERELAVNIRPPLTA
ncbi:DnaJ-domain-containing protein [Coprinopsis marcescibilis]|uniref:DnaJ-domain-containing protein n=1 Tax=Coprinopsis marcescibilis TaxID=230819 RepID=A0A5C3L014_COPMA|nr:DnaJ-domain-containing protein [Coprinopsis marcescibilis]